MPEYNNLTDLPTYQKRAQIDPTTGKLDQNRGIFFYKGKAYTDQTFAQQFPQQYDDYVKATGQAGGVRAGFPAGTTGSPYPSALPANSFEQLVSEAKVQMQKAREANEKRYAQGLSNTSNQGKLVDSSFDSIMSQINADNAAYAADAAGIESKYNAGYDAAEQALTGYGQFSESEAKREGQSREAQAGLSTAQRGLYNSTILDAMTRREREATDRNVADVRERVAGMRTGLLERRAGGATDLAALLAGNRQAGRLRAADATASRFAAKYQQLGDRRNFIERRIDEGPNEVDLANLILQNQTALAAKKKSNTGSDLLGTLAGGVAGGISTGIGSLIGGLFCDRRLKRDIEFIDTLNLDGHTIRFYSFQYTPEAIHRGYGTNGVFVGPMADEVQQAMPQAVRRDKSEYFIVTDRRLFPRVMV